ncbi:hypothetical protein [Streptomyces sp. 3214.6]|uniref:hypothetical protein n=1 Tax=Streptomyces sp. 3214.6 TaxID=1882757 RepID=UPI00090C38D9|nr:hypothetical protein [Streptomyces sp. 3214.6]SHI26911.1 hypothetical protein SAMN05444521_6553 [Streptomyces sp. 3214.6]
MNTERPENDDAAREPEQTDTEDGAAKTAAGGASAKAGTEDGTAEQSAVSEKTPPSEVPEETPAREVPEDATAREVPEEPGAREVPEEADAREVSEGTPASEVPEGAPGRGVHGEAADRGASEGGSAGGVSEGVQVGEVGEEAEVAGSRRRSPVLIASVAAAVLLVGGGGAYLTSGVVSSSGGEAAGSSSGSPSGDGAPAALLLDDYSAGTGTPNGGANGIAPGEPNPYGTTYKAHGTLPDGPSSAPAYWAEGAVTKDEVARLAKALGADGTPVVDGEAWKVGAADGSGPALRVNRQAPGIWTFTRYAPGTDDCTGGTVKCTREPAGPAGDTVSEAVAKQAAAPILKAVGQDDAKVDASQIMGAQRLVNADPVIGGLPTYGWTTGISVSAQGEVVGANGQLQAPVKGDTYPLLSAREALAALNRAPGSNHRMGIGGCASPVPLKDRLESPCGMSTAAPQQETVTVEDAVLGLAPHTSGGRQVLVPSWLFDVKGAGAAAGYTVTQPAVEPAYLESATTPTPTPTGSAPKTRDVHPDGYTAEGKELVVSFTGGVCADYRATATESADEVKVTVTETPWPNKICITIAKQFHKTVQLDQPLGSRTVVGTDGKAIPLEKPGARLPQVQ